MTYLLFMAGAFVASAAFAIFMAALIRRGERQARHDRRSRKARLVPAQRPAQDRTPRPESPMSARPLAIGDTIHGFAHGAFGRDHHDCVRVEAVGPDWIVARGGDRWRGPSFTSGQYALQLCQQARDELCPVDSPCPLDAPDPPLATCGSQP